MGAPVRLLLPAKRMSCPGCNVSAVQPQRRIGGAAGPVTIHSVSAPVSSVTLSMMLTCGLTKLYSVTTPSISISSSVNTAPAAWCALAGTEPATAAKQSTARDSKYLMAFVRNLLTQSVLRHCPVTACPRMTCRSILMSGSPDNYGSARLQAPKCTASRLKS